MTFDLPKPWPEDLRPEIAKKVKASRTKLVVLDDDPTGTQTVHNIPVYTSWDSEVLEQALSEEGNVFYILTNSRSLIKEAAKQLALTIGKNLRAASVKTQQAFTVISRSDSTLRGHYPAEVDALAEGLGLAIDAHIIIPAFFEAGRETINDIHYVHQEGTYTAANKTAFAQDAVFAYKNADLKKWVAEKTANAITEEDVLSINLEDLRLGGPSVVSKKLLESKHKAIIVNATCYRDLDVFSLGLLEAEEQGKRYLYRTAASFVVSRAGIKKRDLLTAKEFNLSGQTGRLVMVGSYVPLSTQQLEHLLSHATIEAIELNATELLANDTQTIIQETITRVNELLELGKDVLIYTSRELIKRQNDKQNLTIGAKISASLVEVLQGLTVRPKFLIAKGGITSSDLATKGLAVKKAIVQGQVLPGVPVWQLGGEAKFPDLDYIVFPGNVGSEDALTTILSLLKP